MSPSQKGINVKSIANYLLREENLTTAKTVPKFLANYLEDGTAIYLVKGRLINSDNRDFALYLLDRGEEFFLQYIFGMRVVPGKPDQIGYSFLDFNPYGSPKIDRFEVLSVDGVLLSEEELNNECDEEVVTENQKKIYRKTYRTLLDIVGKTLGL